MAKFEQKKHVLHSFWGVLHLMLESLGVFDGDISAPLVLQLLSTSGDKLCCCPATSTIVGLFTT
jgi:hypothetical protein